MSLSPVSYRWKSTQQRPDIHYGFIAQDLENRIKEFSGITESGIINHDRESDRYGVNYAELIAPMVKSIQEIHGQCEARDEQLQKIDNLLENHSRRLASLEKSSTQKDAEIQRLRRENTELQERLKKIEKHLGL